MASSGENQKLLDVAGLSRYLSMSKETIYTYVCRKKIPPACVRHIGSALKFDRAEIDRWIDSLNVLEATQVLSNTPQGRFQ